MEIRYINDSDDRKAISRIFERSWRYAYKGIIPQDYLDSIEEGRWIPLIDIPGWKTMICIENGEYAGTSTFSHSRSREYPDDGEVISIYLLPEYINKGYGKRLLEAVLDEMRKEGYREVFLWVLEENTAARKFYEDFRFLCSGDYTETAIGKKKLREVRYVYSLV